jgi:hypothetical protein
MIGQHARARASTGLVASRVVLSCLALTVSAVGARAQTGAPAVPPAQQVAAAVLPLPPDMRAGATVLGYDRAGKLVRLRVGTNDMTCLAPDPKRANFHVACYHKSMEPFMARGRALREEGTKDDQVDSVRFAEAKSGKLPLPTGAAALYSLTGPAGSFDAAAGEAKGARHLFVVYIPYATEKSTGLSARPEAGKPWIMFPGTPKAHIMFVPSM